MSSNLYLDSNQRPKWHIHTCTQAPCYSEAPVSHLAPYSVLILSDWRCFQVYRTLKAGPYTRALAFEQEGVYLASLSAEGHLQVWDVATGKADCNMPKSAPKVQGSSIHSKSAPV